MARLASWGEPGPRSGSRRAERHRRRVRPRLEVLEDRTLPAVITPGSILVAENFADLISGFTSSPPTLTPLVSGVSTPVQAVNDGGDLIVTSNALNALLRIAPDNSQSTISAGGNLSAPRGVAIDEAGNYIVTSLLNDSVVLVSPLGTQTLVTSGGLIDDPIGIVIDASGNYIVASNQSGNNTLVRVTPDGTQSVFSSGGLLDRPAGLALDAAGNVLVVNQGGTPSLVRITPGGAQTLVTNALGAGTPYGVAVEASGNYFVSNQSTNTLVEINPSGSSVNFVPTGSVPLLLSAVPPAPTNLVVDLLFDEHDGIYAPGDLSLREAVFLANLTPDLNTIVFAQGLETVDAGDGLGVLALAILRETAVGPSALEVKSPIRILGPGGDDGITITACGCEPMRLFRVTSDGQLILENLTLTGGIALGYEGFPGSATGAGGGGGGSAGMGGAIFNEGQTTIVNSTLVENAAAGGDGGFGDPDNGASQGDGGNGAGLTGGFGGSGPAGTGGDGGFGSGGGGGAGEPVSPGDGGIGGFGGGGGGGGGLTAGGTGGAGGDGGFAGGAGGLAEAGGAAGGGGGAGLGGAVFNYAGTVIILNSTLTLNLAVGGWGGLGAVASSDGLDGEGLGGAVFNYNGSLTILNSTITGNDSTDGGKGVFTLADGGTATAAINNSIVWEICGCDFIGDEINGGTSLTSGSDNIMGGPFGFAGGFDSGDPGLGELADNGGPTETMAITVNSRAYNAGSNTAAGALDFDQRGDGFDRVAWGTVDIGAYEFQSGPTELRVLYGFHFIGSYYQNFHGGGEKWFYDRLNQFWALTPQGELIRWDGVSFATSRQNNLLLTLNRFVYEHPDLLFKAPVLLTAAEQNDVDQLQTFNGFRFTGSYLQGYHGANEKWFLDDINQQWALTPQGELILWDGMSFASSRQNNLIAVVNALVYDDPDLLFNPVFMTLALAAELSQLQMANGFRFAGSYYQGYYGSNEKSFLDRLGRSWAITPAGELVRWDGISFATSLQNNTAAILSTGVFDNPNVLFGAGLFLSGAEQTELSQLRSDNGFHFAGSYQQGYHGFNEKWFKDRNEQFWAITPEGELIRWDGISFASSRQNNLVANLNGLVYENPNLLFHAPVSLTAGEQTQVSQLQIADGFRFAGSFFQNYHGFNEKSFLDRQNRWWFLTALGELIRWDGISFTTSRTNNTVAIVNPLVFDDPTLLFNA